MSGSGPPASIAGRGCSVIGRRPARSARVNIVFPFPQLPSLSLPSISSNFTGSSVVARET